MKPLIDTYKSLCTQFYDLDKPVPDSKALDFYLREISNSQQPIFEPMCGSGRFLLPMLERGIDIEGSDASIEMLELCKLKYSRNDNEIEKRLHYQTLAELRLSRRFGLIFIPAGSIGLITNEAEIGRCLQSLNDYLLPGGKVIFEVLVSNSTFNVVTSESKIRTVQKDLNSEIVLKTIVTFDRNKMIVTTECEYSLVTNGVTKLKELEYLKLKYYSISEFKSLLTIAGFENISVYGDYDKSEVFDRDSLIIFEARKA
jgi:2-polyprenyl-3-methyl-5-hydroxy-6-metoxy-1,4-benzoquinol methylase